MQRIASNAFRKARKEHQCSFCGGIIKKGEVYDWQKLEDDGELYEWKAHKRCCSLASEYDMYDCWGDGLSSGDFCDRVSDIYGEKYGWDHDFKIPEMALKLFDELKYRRGTNHEIR